MSKYQSELMVFNLNRNKNKLRCVYLCLCVCGSHFVVILLFLHTCMRRTWFSLVLFTVLLLGSRLSLNLEEVLTVHISSLGFNAQTFFICHGSLGWGDFWGDAQGDVFLNTWIHRVLLSVPWCWGTTELEGPSVHSYSLLCFSRQDWISLPGCNPPSHVNFFLQKWIWKKKY